jgi:hypothetical protein
VEYERLLEQRAIEDGPLELIDGQLIIAEPKAPCHSAAVLAVADAIRTALPRGWIVRVQDALALADELEPSPISRSFPALMPTIGTRIHRARRW